MRNLYANCLTHPMHSLLPILITTVAIATALNVLLRQVNMPTVIGYIFTGAIIGPLFGIHVHENEQLEHIAEFGVVFLMFTIGLEFSVSHLKSMKREVFVYGLLQVFVTAFIVALIGIYVIGLDQKTAIIAGAGLSLSSTAIVLKLLNESGKIKSEYGRNSLGILLFQDIAVIPILLMITIFTSQDKSLGSLLMETAINAVIVLGILILFGKYVVGFYFRTASKANSKEIYMGSILFIVVGASYFAHHFGFSYSLGAFIAGMMIADTIHKYQVEADLIPFRDLLLGVFFVFVGLQIDINVVLNNLFTILLLGSSIMLIKILVIFAILLAFTGKATALKTAVTLAQVGEFSLVVFSLLLSNKLLDPVLVQIVMVTVVLSMILTPFIINNTEKLVNLVFKGTISTDPEDKKEIIGDHAILCGYGSFGRTVSKRLDEASINHVIITDNTDNYVAARQADKNAVFGDPADKVLLESLNIKNAMTTIVAADNQDQVKQISAAVALIDPSLKVIAKVASEEHKSQLEEFNHEFVLDGNSHAATLLVDRISKSRLLAKEVSKLQFLSEVSSNDPVGSINLIAKEQARLLDLMSKTFNGLREGKDIMYLKAIHESFSVLSEIIRKTISNIMNEATLSPRGYEQINIVLDNQSVLESMNESLENLGKELKLLSEHSETEMLSQMAVEGLDTILLSLKDIADDYTREDLELLQNMTSSEGVGLSRIRESYLGAERNLDTQTKAVLLSATNRMERLRQLFGSAGENYRKAAQAA